MEPTDRSMPPRIMTIVIPQASSRFGALWRSTLKMLFCVRKVLCVTGYTYKNRIIAANAQRMPRLSLKYRLMLFPNLSAIVVPS